MIYTISGVRKLFNEWFTKIRLKDVLYAQLLILPCVSLQIWKIIRGNDFELISILQIAYCIGFWGFILLLPKVLRVIAYIFVLVSFDVEFWHLMNHGTFSSFQTIYSILTTDAACAYQIFSSNLIYVAIFALSVICFVCACRIDVKIAARRQIAVVLMVLYFISSIFYTPLWNFAPVGTFLRMTRVLMYIHETNVISDEYVRTAKKWNVTALDPKFDLIVYVIGESSRVEHWGIFNYQRNTTPRLAKRKLILFPEMYSLNNITAGVLPRIITEMNVGQSETDRVFPSVVPIYKQAGYLTAWISNQPMESSSIISVQRKIADFSAFNSWRNDLSHYDENVLAPLKYFVNRNSDRKMCVIHLMGQHVNYWQRYPRAFSKYTPCKNGINARVMYDARERNVIKNDYDNAIVYGDYVLDSIIGTADKSAKNPLVIFVADHGEAIFDSAYNGAGHGMPFLLPEQLHIPAFIWTKNYSNIPQQFLGASKNSTVLSSDNLFQTLEWITGIRHSGLNYTDTWMHDIDAKNKTVKFFISDADVYNLSIGKGHGRPIVSRNN